MRWWAVAVVVAVGCASTEPEVGESESAVGGSEVGESESAVGGSESEGDESESEVGGLESEVGGSESAEAQTDPDPSEPPAECTTDRECTLLTDSCGNPHGAPNGSPPLQTRPRHCLADDDPPREPVCRYGQCQTQEAQYAEVRACNEDGECATARTVCGSPMAVNRAQKATFEREQQAMAANVRCREPAPWPSDLQTECLVQLCVLR